MMDGISTKRYNQEYNKALLGRISQAVFDLKMHRIEGPKPEHDVQDVRDFLQRFLQDFQSTIEFLHHREPSEQTIEPALIGPAALLLDTNPTAALDGIAALRWHLQPQGRQDLTEADFKVLDSIESSIARDIFIRCP